VLEPHRLGRPVHQPALARARARRHGRALGRRRLLDHAPRRRQLRLAELARGERVALRRGHQSCARAARGRATALAAEPARRAVVGRCCCGCVGARLARGARRKQRRAAREHRAAVAAVGFAPCDAKCACESLYDAWRRRRGGGPAEEDVVLWRGARGRHAAELARVAGGARPEQPVLLQPQLGQPTARARAACGSTKGGEEDYI